MPKGILNKASLVMVPEAPIDGTMPSVFPEDRSGDFTFTRGSNLSATRVASNGLIEKGRENLLLQSNQFDTTWTLTNTNVTGGQTGYDYSSDAWLLSKSADGAYIQQIKVESVVVTQSIYVKANTSSWCQILNGVGFAYYDLINGVIGSESKIDSSIEAVGTDGWYRISLVSNGCSYFRLYPAESDGDKSGTSGSIYIQDAQLEVGLVATDYIESGATTGTAGLLENEPRIDFTGGGCGALLLEPQRTNLVWFSEYLGGAFELGSSTSIEYNSIVSPDGYKNACKVDFYAQGLQDYFRFRFTNTANTTYVGSIFLKRGNFDEITVRVSGNAVGMDGQATFNLANGTFRSELGSVTPKMEDYGNGWYRCSVGDGTNATIASPSFRVSNQGLEPGFVYAWGAQLEEGSYATSYIPTHGSAVTRSSDGVLSNTNFYDIFGSSSLTQYSIFLDIKDGDDSGSTEVLISKGTNEQGRINLLGGDRICYYSVATGYVTGNIYTDGSPHKYLLVANNGTIKQYFDGSLISTDTNTSDEFTAFNIGGLKSMRISQYIIFPTALTDEECSALTQP